MEERAHRLAKYLDQAIADQKLGKLIENTEVIKLVLEDFKLLKEEANSLPL